MAVSLDTLISRSVNRLGAVHPSIKEYTVELLRRCYAEGIYVQISSGFRSNEEQAWIYGKGRPTYVWNGKKYGTVGSIVSNAKPGTSVHNYGLAIDYFLVTDDGLNSLWTVNEKWRRVGAIAKSMGFEWGGDWTSFRDYPHLQFTKGLTISQLSAGKRPIFPTLITKEVAGVAQTKGTYRIKTGAFPNAKGLADAIAKASADFGWLFYEAADTTAFNPTYRIYTGTFPTKEAAEGARKQITAKYGWLTYLIDETK